MPKGAMATKVKLVLLLFTLMARMATKIKERWQIKVTKVKLVLLWFVLMTIMATKVKFVTKISE